ncbi:SusC/RagA family TonB-linked outer membrane protein [Bacteroidia bacterium]|nr:SusC/RagA family TonB-linked outer membrane protein [Bacteroidia bacterium]
MINPKKNSSSIKANLVKLIRITQITALFLSVGVGVGYADVSVAQQQTKTVTGTVVDNTKEPLIGVNVLVKGTTNGVITDIDGKFSLQQVATGAILQISYVGYITQEVAVGSSNTYNITLLDDSKALEEVVVTGYSTQKKRDLTGAVSVVKVEDVETQVSSNVLQSLQGRIPGVFISTSGSPLGDATSVVIRGTSTLGTSGGRTAAQRSGPLYIIDGLPSSGGMDQLNPQDIESIQVLKDASSASIYGSRAANGVIIITTKHADKQKTTVSARASLRVSDYAKSLSWLNTWERGWVQWRAYRNDGNSPNFGTYTFDDHQDANGNWVLDKINIPEFIDADHTMKAADTDWAKLVGQTSVTQNYNVTVSTGGDKGRSLFTIDYMNNQGTIKETFQDRLSARFNSDYSMLGGRLTVSEHLSLTKTDRSRLDAGSILTNTREIQPIVPLHTVDGIGYGGPVGAMGDRLNPIRRINDSKNNINHYVRLFGDASIDLEIIKNLHIKSLIGMDYSFFWYKNMFLPYREGYMHDEIAVVTNRDERSGNWIWTNTLNYNFDLQGTDHHFDILAGQEMIKYGQEWTQAERRSYATTDPDYMFLGTGETNQINDGSATAYALMSYFGKVGYNYQNKYLLSATVRRDGSSRFGANNRFAIFPAFSVGWRLTEEQFIKNLLTSDFITDLKLRYGWGQTGNQDIGDFASLGLYEAKYSTNWTTGNFQGTAYDILGNNTGTLGSGYRRIQQANPNLKWEVATQHNIGLDFTLLEGKFSGSVDYFIKNVDDILIKPPYIGAIGEGGDMNINGASMRNTGVEGSLSYNQKVGNVNLIISGNIGSYKSKVTDLPPQVWDAYPGNGSTDIIIGHPYDALYGFVTDGLFQNQAEVDAHVKQIGKGVGRIRYKDLNNDGQITLADRTWIGTQDPDFIYGLNFSTRWNQWDAAVFFNGVYGGLVNVASTKQYTDFFGVAFTGENNGKRVLDAWSTDNTSSTIPALSASDANDEKQLSTYYLESRSFLKLRNVEIGYTLPKNISNLLHMQRGRIYVVGENLFKIKKSWGDNAFTGADPETPMTSYPIPFSVTFGVNVTF